MNARKTFGKLLVVSLFVMLFVLLLTLSTSAATHEVTTEAELTEALTNAAAGDTINITADVTTTQQLTIDRSLTFSGNGTLSAGGINVVANVDLTFGGSLKLALTDSILYADANAGGSLTLTDSVAVAFNPQKAGGTVEAAIHVTGCSPTVTLEKNASLTVNASGADKEGMYFHGGSKSIVYIKDNASLTTTGAGTYCHGMRIGTNGQAADSADVTVYLQGSTVEGEAGVTLNVARGFDVRTAASLTLNGSGKVNVNARRQFIFCSGAAKSVVNFTNTDGKTNVTLNACGTANANGVTETEGNIFAMAATTSSLTLNGTFNIAGTGTFAYLHSASAPFVKMNGVFTFTEASAIGRFLEFQTATNCAEIVNINGSVTATSKMDLLYLHNSTKSADANAITVNMTGNFSFVSNGEASEKHGFHITNSVADRVSINIKAREGNTTDAFVYSTPRRFLNLRENTTVDITVDTNRIDVTTYERILYGVGCTDIDLTFKATTVTFTTLATHGDAADAFFAFYGYAAGKKANVNLDGQIAFVNTSIGTDYEKNSSHFGCYNTNDETVVLGLTLRDMDVSSINWRNNSEVSYGSPIVLDNCTGTLTIAETFTAPQIHVKGGSVSTVITGTANLAGLGGDTLHGGLVYSNGATGSITLSGSGTLNFSAGHGIELNGVSNTVTVKDTAVMKSTATAGDRETFFVVNGANPTIYFKDNAKIETPNGKWGHAFRIGTSDGKNPANATIYVQGSTVEGAVGVDIDSARIFDVRANNSATVEVTGKVDLNTDAGILACHGAKKIDAKFLGDNITMTQGSEGIFNLTASEVTFTLEGDHSFTLREGASAHVNFIQVLGTSSNPDFKHTVNITGNIEVNYVSGNTEHFSNIFYVGSTGSTPVEINVNPRKDNKTDSFVVTADRFFNLRENTKVTCTVNTNVLDVTMNERMAYTVGTASLDIAMNATTQTYSVGEQFGTSNMDAFFMSNGNSGNAVSFALTGAVTVTGPYINFFQTKDASDVTLTVDGSLTASYRDNLIYCPNTVTGDIVIDLDCDTLNLTGSRFCDIAGGASLDIDVKATDGNFFTTTKAIYKEDGTVNYEIHWFYAANVTGNLSLLLEGDFTMTNAAGKEKATDLMRFNTIGGTIDVDLIGNFDIALAGSIAHLLNTTAKATYDIKPRENSPTDKFHYNGWRVFNLRDDTNTEINWTGNNISLTLSSSIIYSTNIKSNVLNITSDKMVVTGCGERAFNYNNSPQNVELNISGNVDISTKTSAKQNIIYIGAGTAKVTIKGANGEGDTGFVVKDADRLSNMRAGVTGSLTVTGKADVTVTEKVMYHVDNAVSIILNGDITMSNTNDWIISTNCEDPAKHASHGTHTIQILGNTKLICSQSYTAIQVRGPRDVSVIVGGNAEIQTGGNAIDLYEGAAGSITIQDNAKINGSCIITNGTGKIDLTIKGTPTLNFTTQYNGIQHKSTGDAKIDLSGVWSTNKTIFCSGGKKDITVSGADTVLTLGGSGIYSSGAGCVLNITVSDATINGSCSEGVFTGNGGGTINATVNSGKISNSNKFMVSAHEASVVNLTINGGELSSNSFFLQYQHTASGSVTYNGGTVKAKDHNLVNFGSGKVDFTMTGGTVTAPNSFIWYENKDANAATTSTVKVSGGTFTGGYMNIFKTAAVNINLEGDAIVNITGKAIYYHDSAKGNVTIGGNAKFTVTGGWAITYEGTASGSVTLKDNAVITGNEHGFVNNGTKKVDFTIQDNASFTITKYTAVYYGGNFPADVVNEIKILGGTLTDSGTDSAITFPGSGEFKLTVSGGTITANSNAILINPNSNPSKFTVNVTGGSIVSNTNDGMEVSNKDTLTVNMTVSGGTFHGKHMDLTYGSGYPLQFWGKNNTLTITGGNFLADYAHAAMMVAGGATANVYGGYFEAGALCTVRATENGTLNIYGGEIYYNGNTSKGGMPVRSGTGSAVGNVNVYGGNYYTDGTGTIFCCMNNVSNLTLYGGYNTWGGRGLVESANPSSIKSSSHGIGDMWTYKGVSMATGAAVRIVEGSSGLRFMGLVSAETVAHYKSIADEGSIAFGTLIAPADYVQQVARFTKEDLDAAGLNYLDLAANNGLIEMEDGSYQIRSAITNIKEANRAREFAAVCYVTYTVNGNEVTSYAVYREVKNARSVEQVARIALQSGRRYTESQLAILTALAPEGEAPVIDLYLIAGQSNAAGSTRFSEDFRNSDSAFTEGYPNIYYSGTAAGGTDFASKNYVEVELAKAGFGGNAVNGMGAELGMAKALSQYYNEETGRTAAIIKYGYGGTALADSISGQNYPEGSWISPTWLAEHGKKDEYKSGGLYRAFVQQIERSISDYRAMGYDVNIVAAYWMQGESDRTNANYAAMFETWVSDLRNDVYEMTGSEDDKSLPILVGEISYSYNPDNMHYNPAFIAMQNELPKQIDNLYVINQSPLATANTRGDTGHWSCDDMLLIGQMVATTALNELVLGEEDEKYVMPYLAGTPIAEVYDAENNLIGTYSSFSWAINTAPAGATVKLLDNLTIYGPLGINNPSKITVDGQNYMIDVKTELGDAMKLVKTDIVLKDFNIKNHSTTEWGLQTYQGAKFIWNGGSFEAESIGIVMNDAAVGQLHNVTVSVRNGVEGHAAAIYMGANNADIWVNDSTVTANGTAEAIRAINGYVTVTGNSVITGGTDTAFAISQRDFNGYLAIGEGVVVNGVVVNNGYGYAEGEDVVELPSPELPEAPVDPEEPEVPDVPADPDLPDPEEPDVIDPETPVEPDPETPVEPDPETPVEPDPETPVEPDPETPVEPDPETPVEPDPETPVEPEA